MTPFETVYQRNDYAFDPNFKKAMRILSALHTACKEQRRQPWTGPLAAEDRVSATAAILAIGNTEPDKLVTRPWQLIIASLCNEAIEEMLSQGKLETAFIGRHLLVTAVKMPDRLGKDILEKVLPLFDAIAEASETRRARIIESLALIN